MDTMNNAKKPSLNVDEVIEQTGLDMEDYLEIYELFQENFQELMDEIKDALTQKDTDRIMRGAHTLKGSTSNIGFTDLSVLAKEMQEHPEDLELVSRNIPKMMEIYEKLNDEVQALAATAP